MGIDGFIYGELKTGTEKFIDQNAAFASVNLRVYSNDGVIVASTVHNASSVFFDSASSLKRVTRDALAEFEDSC